MLSRRSALLLPLLATACGGGEEQSFPPLRYDYLAPLRLNVAAIQVEQRFVPAGVPPDVTQYAPVSPLAALRAMAEDRLQTLGSNDRALFVIQNASLTRRGSTITGNFAVELDIYNTPTTRAAFAQASVSGTYSGDLDDLPARLYDLTKNLMDRMNVEFEYQVRRALASWLLRAGAPQAPVQQQPLTQGPLQPPPAQEVPVQPPPFTPEPLVPQSP
jgi:hypothetical protein